MAEQASRKDRKLEPSQGKKGFKMPSTAVLLMMMIFIVTLCTYVVPAGEFTRSVDEATNRTIVVAGTYTQVAQSPVGIQGMLSSVFRGLTSASDIIAFIFVVGGAFGLVSDSGAINAGLGKLIRKFSGKENVLIAIIMI